jgi:hypothetical protein
MGRAAVYVWDDADDVQIYRSEIRGEPGDLLLWGEVGRPGVRQVAVAGYDYS